MRYFKHGKGFRGGLLMCRLVARGAEAVGYDGASCYLSDGGAVPAVGGRGGWRARHASDGDILAPPCRPESGAFSGEHGMCDAYYLTSCIEIIFSV